jgi:hypothetical protein
VGPGWCTLAPAALTARCTMQLGMHPRQHHACTPLHASIMIRADDELPCCAGWHELIPMPLDPETSMFSVNCSLPPGTYHYTFLVDGRWRTLSLKDEVVDATNGIVCNKVRRGAGGRQQRGRQQAAGGIRCQSCLLRWLLLMAPRCKADAMLCGRSMSGQHQWLGQQRAGCSSTACA